MDAGEIGEVVRVETTLCNDMADLIASDKTYHSQPVGGGVLLDCGIYCASWLDNYLPAGEPHVAGFAGIANRDGVDLYADAVLEMGGKTATLECAFDRAKPRRATLVGTKGRVVVEDLHRCQRATVYADGDEPRVIERRVAGKRQASLACGHASLWVYVAHELDGRCQDLYDRGTIDKMGSPDFACPVAGALPIRDQEGVQLATLCVSGLHEGRDHELAVRALAEVEGLRYGIDVPAYTWLAK